MASLMESVPVFRERMAKLGVPLPIIQKFVDAGTDTMSRFAFGTNYNPSMTDDKNLTDWFQLTVDPGGGPLSPGLVVNLRLMFFECHTMYLASLREKVDRKEEDAPRRVPQPERTERLMAQRNKLVGVPVSGPLEPAYCLIDLVSQQKDDEVLRYISPEACLSREQELRATKSIKSEKADTSSDLKVRQCLQRRSLAYDQLDLFSYETLEGWHTYLFHLMSRDPLEGYKQISLEQVLQADKQAFIAMSDLCRAGLGRDATGERRAEAALKIIRADPMVMTLLNPLPRSSSSRPDPKPPTSFGKGKGKGAKGPPIVKDYGNKTKGKGKGKSKLPKGLIGLHGKTADGDPICFGYNLAGCSGCSPGARCTKGYHLCAKCLGTHSLNACSA
jgi:hypothetical protein